MRSADDGFLAMLHCYISITLVALGLVIIFIPIAMLIKWWKIRHWPKIPSRIVSSSIQSRRNPVGAGVVIKEYRPSVEYEYQVRGRRYLGNRIGFRDSRLWTDCLKDAEAGLLTSGTDVMVGVSPVHAQQSILDTRVTLRDLDFLGMLMVLGFLIVGVGGWIVTMACP